MLKCVCALGRVSKLMRKWGEERKEKKRVGCRRRERACEKEGGRELQAARLDHRSNTAVFCFCFSEENLPNSPSYSFFLLPRCHDPDGHLALFAHLDKRKETL